MNGVSVVHRNERSISGLSEALLSGDWEAAQPYLDDRAVYHIPGRNALAGTYRGWEEILWLNQRRAQLLADRPHHIELIDTSRSDDHLAIRHRFEAELGGRRLAWTGISIYFFEDGRVAAFWLFVDDLDAFNAFWS